MSYLAEPPTFELDPTANSAANNNATSTTVYDYHLPHTKTIDLIGEEFAPKSRNATSGNVVVENINPAGIPTSAHNLGTNVVLVNTSNSGTVPLQVQQILQQAQTQVSPIFKKEYSYHLTYSILNNRA